MNINATLVGEFLVVFLPAIAALSYYLGKRKTKSPALTTFVGVLLALIPPLALIYVGALSFKNDLPLESK